VLKDGVLSSGGEGLVREIVAAWESPSNALVRDVVASLCALGGIIATGDRVFALREHSCNFRELTVFIVWKRVSADNKKAEGL
jgi:hypothetical protein